MQTITTIGLDIAKAKPRWDVVADFSLDLEYLIDPIVEPHLPWNKDGGEPAYTVLALPSPERLESGDRAALDAVETSSLSWS
jgi:hypothetical protein